ncbi:MAG: DUF4491 family protein [Tissierellia bacterium]|nr:DUF4491 family protein [Tissierellia bacterium]
MNYHGLIVGVYTFFAIGIFHPIVIKAEYYFSKRCWPFFLILGLLCLFFSLKTSDVWSAILGITAFCFLWSIKELYEQAERVERGLYPKRKKGTLL